MTIKYDPVADAAYFSMRKGKVAKTVRMEDRIVADFDAKGNIIGIEVLDASNQGFVDLKGNVMTNVPVQNTEKMLVAA